MFTGLIEETAKVLWLRATERGTQLQIAAEQIAQTVRTGDSISVNGCCLTVTAHRAEQIVFDLLDETLQRTNLKNLKPDNLVNLERPLLGNGRLGGHFVQGHIDCASPIISFAVVAGGDYKLEIELAPEFARYVVSKGSVAVNGISLTVAEVSAKSFAAFVIPHTRRSTNLHSAQVGDWANVEFDIIGKYVERMASAWAKK